MVWAGQRIQIVKPEANRAAPSALRTATGKSAVNRFRNVFAVSGRPQTVWKSRTGQTVPGIYGCRSYGKSVKKRRNTKLTHFLTGNPSGP